MDLNYQNNTMKNLLLIVALLVSTLTFSQVNLTVKEAIEKALANNYQIKLVNANVEIASKQNNWGSAGFSPTFALNLTNAANVSDNTNNPASFFPGKVFNDNLTLTLDMNWTIFNGFGVRINKERFEKLEAQTKGNAMVVIENTIYETIVAYYTTVVQNRKLKIVTDLLVYSKDKLDYFKLKSELGTTSSFDLLQFENQVLTDSSNIIMQELALQNAKRNLNLVMGEGVNVDYDLVEDLTFTVPQLSYSQMEETMIADNLNLKNQYFNLQLQDLNIKAQKSAYYPVVSINAGIRPSIGYIELLDSPIPSTNTNSLNYYGNISARYTIFNGWNRKRNVQIAEIQQGITTLQTDDMTLKLSHQLKGTYEMYQMQTKIEEMTMKRVLNAKELWTIGKEKYDLGLINVFNLNDIKLQFEQATLTYYDRLFDLLKTHYDLLRVTGQITQKFQ
jgi:outer membrane protein